MPEVLNAEQAERPPRPKRSDKEWLTRKEAVGYLLTIGCRIGYGSLSNMASNNNAGHGPVFYRFRWNCIMYRRQDLEEWAKLRQVRVE